MRSPRVKAHPIAMAVCWLLTVFLVLFPKGGIKAGFVPITWGYLLLAITAPPLAVIRLLAFPLKLTERVWWALALMAPMQLLFLYSYFCYGTSSPAFAFSTFVELFVLPYTFLIVYSAYLPYIDGERFSRWFRVCVLLAAIWGIFLFFWHPFTGHFIEIPYLTVNAQDFGELERTKHIARGLFLKLISTYNNGNLYGVATLILLPLYNLLEPARWRRNTVKVALLLTLSRTVWVGVLLNELLPVIAQLARQIATFPRVYLRSVRTRLMAVVVTVGLVFVALMFSSSPLGRIGFLLDPTAGNRLGEVQSVSGWTLIPTVPVWGFAEVLYASAGVGWGYVGFFAFTLLMFSPILLLLADPRALQSPSRRAAFRGLCLYIVMAASDGSFNYIPTMAFYWFVYMIFLFGWPKSRRERVASSADAAPRLLSPEPHLA